VGGFQRAATGLAGTMSNLKLHRSEPKNA
jgi:hypothetical protein